MQIMATVQFFGVDFPTILVFLFVGILLWLFIFWNEGRKDGFTTTKIFDYAFGSTVLAAFLYYLLHRYYSWHSIYKPNVWLLRYNQYWLSFILGLLASLLLASFLAKKWKWSVYRFLDIHTLAFVFWSLPVSLGVFLIYHLSGFLYVFCFLLFLFLFVYRFRGQKLTSGHVFASFMVFVGFFLFFFRNEIGGTYFSGIFIAIGVLNFFSRRSIAMNKKPLPKDFLDKIRALLTRKEAHLLEEEEHLKERDPYLQPGRTSDNADTVDEVVLEDTAKEHHDDRLNFIHQAKNQVSKALQGLRQGTYGKCESCGVSIDKARLSAYPETTLCLSCAEDAETAAETEEEAHNASTSERV
jgi:RNA polymerase-binding transcription factor DksA